MGWSQCIHEEGGVNGRSRVLLLARRLRRGLGAMKISRARVVRALRVAPGEQLVVLCGDSITRGQGSFNFVDLLARRMAGERYRFLNAGVDGDFAYNLLRRMRPVIESQPQHIIVLIGTNDVQLDLSGGDALMQSLKRLPQVPTLDWYLDNLRQVVATLRRCTRARLALCSLPALGEDLDSAPNCRVRLYNAGVKALAIEKGVAYLPIYECMDAYLRARQRGAGRAYSGTAGVHDALMRHKRESWDEIAAANGYLLLTDGIHCNSTCGTLIADLVEGFVRVADR
jgi:acyl-CoA thioesterase I